MNRNDSIFFLVGIHLFMIGPVFSQSDQDMKMVREAFSNGNEEKVLEILHEMDGEEAIYWKGRALKQLGKYQKAVEVLGQSKGTDERIKPLLKSCQDAIEWKKDPVCSIRLEKTLNSRYGDYSPEWGDTTYSSLIFTTTRPNSDRGPWNEELYFSTKKDYGKWSDPIPFEDSLNTDAHEGSISIDPVKGKGFYTRCDGMCKTRRVKRRADGQWKDVGGFDLLQPCAPDSVNHGQGSYSPELQLYFFASDLPGGKGGYDIWYLMFDPETGKWTDPVNAGPEVNTPKDEMFPYIRKDGTLYFSSNGWTGMGGLDIFKSKRKGENDWSKAKNMGYPINSEADDFGIIFEGNMMRGYFSSGRKRKEGKGKDEIYYFFKET